MIPVFKCDRCVLNVFDIALHLYLVLFCPPPPHTSLSPSLLPSLPSRHTDLLTGSLLRHCTGDGEEQREWGREGFEQAQKRNRGWEREERARANKKLINKIKHAQRKRESQEEGGECSAPGQHFHACVQGLCEYTMGCIGSRRLSKHRSSSLADCGMESRGVIGEVELGRGPLGRQGVLQEQTRGYRDGACMCRWVFLFWRAVHEAGEMSVTICVKMCVRGCIPHLPALPHPLLIYDTVWQHVYMCVWVGGRGMESRGKSCERAYL